MFEMKIGLKKVLILGSGGLKIGQAGEFDYSGSQAIKALQEEGIYTILINPNIATVQTSKGMADRVYFLPVTVEYVEKVIEKERPEGILLSFGGQTALNCGVELHTTGVLERYGVRVLGTSVRAIQLTEDRELFVNCLKEIDVKYPVSTATKSVVEAKEAAQRIGYPVMIRVGYALGGKGSGICRTEEELLRRCEEAFYVSSQVLVEEWLGGWKEIEYEVVRDQYDHCVSVCNMENIDPLGIHTGESMVVAPSQTLSNAEYHLLREVALKVIRHLGIVGECNIQYALDPHRLEYRIIEVNARLSRSSALASKATGYPLAHVAAKLALGYSLLDLVNKVTQKTTACFEPALDYIVLKMPRWDLQKFEDVDSRLGSEMKSVGEVMAIGRTFEEVLQKAVRMVGDGKKELFNNESVFDNVENALASPTDKRLFAIITALRLGWSVDKIYDVTKIDKWFLFKIKKLVDFDLRLCTEDLTMDLLRSAKQQGFSDVMIALNKHKSEKEIRALRKQWGILPVVKQIDTLAAEYPAKTNYLYMTYNGTVHDVSANDVSWGGVSSDVLLNQRAVMVLGGGVYRIGSSVEFDWCCVQSVLTAQKQGYRVIMLNCNPETVSTDYDMCDRLYFEEITQERVLDIYEFEQLCGVIVSMGGQTPNMLALKLHQEGVRVLGTSPVDIDRVENRHAFSQLLDRLQIDQPEWRELTSVDEAVLFASRVGYPVLIRPSYVLSGAAMKVVWDDESLVRYLQQASKVNPEYPVVITKFIENAKEIEFDAVAAEGKIVVSALCEHIENAGVHSGDATIVLPAQKLYLETVRQVRLIAQKIAKELNLTGPFNIQYLAYHNNVKVIECNVRASRSFPFCSKVMNVNMIDLATRAMLGLPVEVLGEMSLQNIGYVGVKAAQFSFSRLKGADPMLGVEMASTGEVACFGVTVYEAFLKAFLAAGFVLPKKTILLSTGPLKSKVEFIESAKILERLGYTLLGSFGTAAFLMEQGVAVTGLHWPLEEGKPNIINYLREKKIDLVINIPKNNQKEELENDYLIRRMAVDLEIPLITDINIACMIAEALEYFSIREMDVRAWDEYV